MGIKNWFYSKKHDEPQNDMVEGLSFDISKSNKDGLKNFVVKAVGYVNRETYRREN